MKTIKLMLPTLVLSALLFSAAPTAETTDLDAIYTAAAVTLQNGRSLGVARWLPFAQAARVVRTVNESGGRLRLVRPASTTGAAMAFATNWSGASQRLTCFGSLPANCQA